MKTSYRVGVALTLALTISACGDEQFSSSVGIGGKSDETNGGSATTLKPGDIVYVQAQPNGRTDTYDHFDLYWKLNAQTFEKVPAETYFSYSEFPASYRPIQYSIYRVQIDKDNPRYAKMLGQSEARKTHMDAFWYVKKGKGTVYVDMQQMRHLHSFEVPYTVHADTLPTKKSVVVLHGATPRVLLIEGNAQDQYRLVHVSPAVLGRGRHVEGMEAASTPFSSDSNKMKLGWLALSKHMTWASVTGAPMHPGVGFTVHYSTLNYDGLPYAYYFHNSPWWDTWTPDSLVAPKTLYGSSGCINLPDDRYKTFDVLGKQVSFAELFFRWASSSLKCSNTETGIANADAARMDVNDWYAPSKDCPIPVYSIATIDSLDAFVPYAAQIQTQYASFVAAAHP